MDALNRALALQAEWALQKPLSPKDKKRLDDKFRLEFNFNSNHIEGNTLTYGETKLLLLFDDTTGNHTMREYEEMKAHDVGYKLITQWASNQTRLLTEQDIKELNEIILVRPFYKEAITSNDQPTRKLIKIGDYKEEPNSVRLANGEIHEYASPQETPIEMRNLMEWYRANIKKLDPVSLAALFHHKFVSIHPFDDGNGRSARLLMNYILLQNGFPPVVIKSKEKKDYLRALRRADAGNPQAFVIYLAEQLIWSLKLALKAAKGEDLREPYDIEKEISVWKKSLGALKIKDDILQHNADVFLVYQKGIKELFEEFIQRHQVFDELFVGKTFLTKINGYSKLNAGLDQFAGAMHDHQNEVANYVESKALNSKSSSKEINLFEITHHFQDFNKPGVVSFSMVNRVRVLFRPETYQVEYEGNSEPLVKPYEDILSEEEIQAVISGSVNYLFQQIKKRTQTQTS